MGLWVSHENQGCAVKAGDLSAELPSAELDVKGPELGGKLPDAAAGLHHSHRNTRSEPCL